MLPQKDNFFFLVFVLNLEVSLAHLNLPHEVVHAQLMNELDFVFGLCLQRKLKNKTTMTKNNNKSSSLATWVKYPLYFTILSRVGIALSQDIAMPSWSCLSFKVQWKSCEGLTFPTDSLCLGLFQYLLCVPQDRSYNIWQVGLELENGEEKEELHKIHNPKEITIWLWGHVEASRQTNKLVTIEWIW